MNRYKIQLPTVQGVVPSQVATLDVPIGPRLHVIWLEGTVKKTGTAPGLTDIMGLIQLKIDGKVQRTVTAARLIELNRLNGEEYKLRWQRSTDDGATFGALGNATLAATETAKFQVPIYFSEPWRKQYLAAEFGALPTTWAAGPGYPNGTALKSVQVEITVPNVANTSLHAISAWVDQDDGTGLYVNGIPQVLMTKWKAANVTYGAAGELDITTFPRRDALQSFHLWTNSPDTITDIDVLVDNKSRHKVTRAQNDQALIGARLNADALAADRFDVVFDADDKPDSALDLNGVLNFLVKPTLSGAAATNKSISALLQAYGPPD